MTPGGTHKTSCDVVVRYSGQDGSAAAEIAEGLRGNGVSVYTTGSVVGESDDAVEVIKALSACEVAVFLLSAEAVADGRVLEDLALAVSERRRVVPLAMRGTAYPAGLSPQWTYWLSATEVHQHRDVDATVELLGQVLADIALARRPVVPRGRRLRGEWGAREGAGIQSTRSGQEREIAPSALLRAQSRAMPLIAREQEMARLEAWALRDDLFGVRLVTGTAGQGKSRLARELGDRLAVEAWQVIEVGRTRSVAEALGRLSHRPSLFVVDYAETQVDKVAELVEAVADVELFATVRLLLLARSAGEWWTQLISRSALVEELLATSGTLTLSSLADDREASVAIYRAARVGFQGALGLPADDLNDAGFLRQRSIFDIMEAALVDVMSAMSRSGQESTSLPLLAHERRYVLAIAEDEGLGGLDGVDLDRFLTVLTLFGATSERSAVDLLRTVESDLGPGELRKLARLCRRLYPGEDRYIDGVKPDSLAEKLVAEVVTDDPALISEHSLWHSPGAGSEQLRRALTILARAAVTYPAVVPQLRRIVQEARYETLAAAIEVSTLIPDPSILVDQLDHILETQARTPADTLSMLALVPEETVALAELAARLARGAISELPPAGSRTADEVNLLLTASNRFSDAGWGSEAANTAGSAVEDLEAAGGETEMLARARCNLSNRLWEIGRGDEALAPARLSVEWFSAHAAGGLAGATAENNLAFRLVEAGALDEALAHATKALQSFRTADSIAGIATALNNLTCICVAQRDFETAVRHGAEAVRIRRTQAFHKRDHFLPYIARALANTAPAALAAGDAAAARKLIAEARALHEITARKAPIFAYEEAESATIDGVMLAVTGADAQARAAFELAGRLLSPLSMLGRLHDRLAKVVKQNLDLLLSGETVEWANVAVMRHEMWAHEAGAMLVLPQLLEYRDL